MGKAGGPHIALHKLNMSVQSPCEYDLVDGELWKHEVDQAPWYLEVGALEPLPRPESSALWRVFVRVGMPGAPGAGYVSARSSGVTLGAKEQASGYGLRSGLSVLHGVSPEVRGADIPLLPLPGVRDAGPGLPSTWW